MRPCKRCDEGDERTVNVCRMNFMVVFTTKVHTVCWQGSWGLGSRISDRHSQMVPALSLKEALFLVNVFFFFRRGFLRRTRDRGMVGRILDTPFSVGKLSLQGAIDVK